MNQMVIHGRTGLHTQTVASASIRVTEPEASIEEVPQGHAAVFLEVKTARDEEGRTRILRMGPLHRRLRSIADLGGKVELRSGYDDQQNKHVATLQIHDEETLGRTIVTFSPQGDGHVDVTVHALADGAAGVRVTCECRAAVSVEAPWEQQTSPPIPPPGAVRVAAAAGAVSLWLVPRASSRQLEAYLAEIEDPHGRRSRFASDAGVWSFGQLKAMDLIGQAGPGVAAIPALLRIHRHDREGAWVMEAARRAASLGIQHATGYVRLRGWAMIEGAPPWPATAPIVAIGTF